MGDMGFNLSDVDGLFKQVYGKNVASLILRSIPRGNSPKISDTDQMVVKAALRKKIWNESQALQE